MIWNVVVVVKASMSAAASTPVYFAMIGAAVALKPDASATPEELRAFARDKIAAYKYPRQVWLVDELPKGPTGKILRRELRDMARQGDVITVIDQR